MKKVLKYATGQEVPKGAIYLVTIKNGVMDKERDYYFVWHYFLVDVKEVKERKRK